MCPYSYSEHGEHGARVLGSMIRNKASRFSESMRSSMSSTDHNNININNQENEYNEEVGSHPFGTEEPMSRHSTSMLYNL